MKRYIVITANRKEDRRKARVAEDLLNWHVQVYIKELIAKVRNDEYFRIEEAK